MNSLFQQILEAKTARRQRLMALSYPEKARIVEKMRAAACQIRSIAKIQKITNHPTTNQDKSP